MSYRNYCWDSAYDIVLKELREHNMDHVITTGLDFSKSVEVINKAFQEQQEKYPQYKPLFAWTDQTEAQAAGEFSFKATPSMEIKGSLVVESDKVTIKFGKLPFLANMFKGTAIKMVEKEVQTWVEKAKTGQL